MYIIIKDEKRKTPWLIAEKEVLRGADITYIFPSEIPYNKENSPQVTLDYRAFVDKNNPNNIVTRNSLILDVRKTTNEYGKKPCNADSELLMYSTLTLRNVGYDLVGFKIQGATITFNDNSNIKLKPDKHCELHTYVKNGDTIDIDISYIYNNDNYALIDNKLLSKDFIEKTKKFSGENIFDSYLPSIPDKYNKIELDFSITNKLNVSQYCQKVCILVEHNRYFSISSTN